MSGLAALLAWRAAREHLHKITRLHGRSLVAVAGVGMLLANWALFLAAIPRGWPGSFFHRTRTTG